MGRCIRAERHSAEVKSRTGMAQLGQATSLVGSREPVYAKTAGDMVASTFWHSAYFGQVLDTTRGKMGIARV